MLLDVIVSFPLLTLHLYWPLVLAANVDELLASTVVQCPLESPLSQEYTGLPELLALHVSVRALPSGTSPPTG